MVSSVLPPSFKLRPSQGEEPGAGFGVPLSAPRRFTGPGHGGDASISSETLAALVTSNQEFEGFEGFHTAESLEAELAGASASNSPIAAEQGGNVGVDASYGSLVVPRRLGA